MGSAHPHTHAPPPPPRLDALRSSNPTPELLSVVFFTHALLLLLLLPQPGELFFNYPGAGYLEDEPLLDRLRACPLLGGLRELMSGELLLMPEDEAAAAQARPPHRPRASPPHPSRVRSRVWVGVGVRVTAFTELHLVSAWPFHCIVCLAWVPPHLQGPADGAARAPTRKSRWSLDSEGRLSWKLSTSRLAGRIYLPGERVTPRFALARFRPRGAHAAVCREAVC